MRGGAFPEPPGGASGASVSRRPTARGLLLLLASRKPTVCGLPLLLVGRKADAHRPHLGIMELKGGRRWRGFRLHGSGRRRSRLAVPDPRMRKATGDGLSGAPGSRKTPRVCRGDPRAVFGGARRLRLGSRRPRRERGDTPPRCHPASSDRCTNRRSADPRKVWRPRPGNDRRKVGKMNSASTMVCIPSTPWM